MSQTSQVESTGCSANNRPENTYTDDPVFVVGEKVAKRGGYAFDGEVRAVFTNTVGQTRYVVESEAIPLMLHIFNGRQLTTRDE